MKNFIFCPQINHKVSSEIEYFVNKFNNNEEMKKFSDAEWVWGKEFDPNMYYEADNIVFLDYEDTRPLLNFLSGVSFSYRILGDMLDNNGETGIQIKEQIGQFGFKPKTLFYVYDDVNKEPLSEAVKNYSAAILINGGLANFENEVLINFIQGENING